MIASDQTDVPVPLAQRRRRCIGKPVKGEIGREIIAHMRGSTHNSLQLGHLHRRAGGVGDVQDQQTASVFCAYFPTQSLMLFQAVIELLTGDVGVLTSSPGKVLTAL